ncbi:MAG: cytidine deaminase [Acidobacteria bacterium]|nr:cytidine deaminase [Acidobacteriota bacterium]MCB9397011.1 cytidine deaminase [Acidobacteriota bacterium]
MGQNLELALAEMAWQALARAYAPYSKFQVGAALLLKDGTTWTGCNVENASYGGTICAERTAIVKAVSEGKLQPGGLDKVVVACNFEDDVWPCGICRQVIEEFCHADTEILISRKQGMINDRMKQSDLLPHAFGPSHLN